jgi:hypothetical protein
MRYDWSCTGDNLFGRSFFEILPQGKAEEKERENKE